MIVDKPEWVSHQGMPIWSIDIDHVGERVVTAGSENRVRIWAAAPILSARAEVNAAQPKVLATLTDHTSAVSVVRFSPAAHMVASGSDDALVLLYRLQPGQGKATFGSKDAPNVENWRLAATLRGHSSNISDLTWCPDGTKLASSSLDNLVIVWDAMQGRQIVQLSGHYGHVKGVAWDPFNHFLASQGENDGIFIWSTRDWALITKVQEPYKNSVASHSFHARLHWSPDGQTLVGTNALSLNTQQAPLIRRNAWDAPHQLCGHKRPICVARYNPRMFYKRDDAGSDQAAPVCAIGSGDKKFSVWSTEAKPLLVGKDFFTGCVMDLAWTPDGYTLMACSYDGTIAVVTFNDTELGRRLPDSDMSELVQQLYGDQRKRGEALVTDASLMALELNTQGTGNAVAVVQARGLPLATSSALDARLGPAGGAPGSFQPASGAAAASRDATGRKRVMPTPVGGGGGTPAPAAVAAPVVTSTAARPASQVPQPVARQSTQNGGPPPAKRLAPTPVGSTPAPPTQTTTLRTTTTAAPAQGVMVVAAATAHKHTKVMPDSLTTTSPAAPATQLSAPPVQGMLTVSLGSRPATSAVDTSGNGFGDVAVTVEVVNNLSNRPGGPPMAKIQCSGSLGGQGPPVRLWFDMIQGNVVLLTGTLNFVAAVTSTGDLLVFSAAGRRVLPPVALGGPAAFVAHDKRWQLLVLSLDGQLRIWNLQETRCILDVSLAPVLASCGGAEVTAVQLSSSGAPLVLLSNHHGYTYMEGMRMWCRIADDAFPASQFHSSFAGSQGELGRVQAGAAAARNHVDVIAAAMQPAAVQARASRAHLESNMAAALALRSPKEWKNWLCLYVRQLSGDGDEARLREVIHDLLGPVRWTPATHPAIPEHQVAAAGGTGAGSWAPSVLGYNKRSLLRNDIVKILMRTRTATNQRLVQETLDMLKEADAAWPPEQQQHRG